MVLHKVHQIDSRTWHIDELDASMYLLTGETSALLIDTAYGAGDLREMVRSLTDLPYRVIVTHAHPDHIGGVGYFSDVYVHRADLAPLAMTTTEQICRTVRELVGNEIDHTHPMVPYSRFHIVREGDVFDLGGRVLRVVEVPGHSMGSIALVDEANDAVFSGDACNPNQLLSLPRELRHILTPGTAFSSVRVMLDSLKRIRALPVTRIFTGHLHELDFHPASMSLADHLIECCERILSGTVLPGMIEVSATEKDPGFQCVACGGDRFSYDPNHISDDWVIKTDEV